MATLAGKSGYIQITANTNYAFASWTADMRSDVLDTTSFASLGYRENIAGLTSAKISARGPFNSTAMAITAGNSYSMVLAMSASVSLSITARVETITITTDVSKPIEINISAQSNGAFSAAVA